MTKIFNTEDDIKKLIANEVAEGKSIEYKTELPTEQTESKKEFLADVSSFANTIGGDLIFGIREEGSIAKEISGLAISDMDKEISRLENMIRDGLKPRIQYSIHSIKLADGKFIILINVKQSWIAPHRVGDYGKFYARNAKGKYPLDVPELRAAFNLSETIKDKIENFHYNRVAKIEAGDVYIPLLAGGNVIMHLIPFEAFSSKTSLDPAELEKLSMGENSNLFFPMSGSGWSPMINLEGLLLHHSSQNQTVCGCYLQIYRNSIIEAVEAYLLSEKSIPYTSLETKIVESVKRYGKLLELLNIQTPIYLFITYTGIAGSTLPLDWRYTYDAHPIKQDIIHLPNIEITDLKENLLPKLREAFKIFWNAAGLPQSLNFDKDGNFKH